jgi:hypothetical protein
MSSVGSCYNISVSNREMLSFTFLHLFKDVVFMQYSDNRIKNRIRGYSNP